MSDTYHVIPLNDRKVHVDSGFCACHPRTETRGTGKLVIHNAYDGREFYEEDKAFDEVKSVGGTKARKVSK